MTQRDAFFNYFIGGMEKEMQATLHLMFTKMCLQEDIEKRREREQLKREIKAELLADIKFTADISDVVQEIEELKKAIDSLGR